MLGENELKLLIVVSNDYIKTLPESAGFCVAEQVKVAVGNLEAYLKAYEDSCKPPLVEDTSSP